MIGIRLKDFLVAAFGAAVVALAVWRAVLWAEGPAWFHGLGLAVAIAAACYCLPWLLCAILGRERMQAWAKRRREGLTS